VIPDWAYAPVAALNRYSWTWPVTGLEANRSPPPSRARPFTPWNADPDAVAFSVATTVPDAA
jgi:hypothetical protein